MAANYRVLFFALIFVFGWAANGTSHQENEKPTGVGQQPKLCTVHDVSGKSVQVQSSALSGPQVFLVVERGGALLFWTVADAQELLRQITQREKIGHLQPQLDMLCAYVADRHQQPIDAVKYAAVLALFDEFKIAPRLLTTFAEWSIALTQPTRNFVVDPLRLVHQAVDLSVIDAKTGKVMPVVVVSAVQQKVLQERAAGGAKFPFLYQRKLPRNKNTKKIPKRSITVVGAGAVSYVAKFLAAVVVVGGGGVAVSKLQKPAGPTEDPKPQAPQRSLVPPAPIQEPKLKPAVVPDLTRAKKLIPRNIFKPFRRGYVPPKVRMACDLRQDFSVAEKVSLEMNDTEVFLGLLHRCALCTQPDPMLPDDDAMDDGDGDDEDAWIDAVPYVSGIPLFFIKHGKTVVAVSEACFKHARAQCTENELQVLAAHIPVRELQEIVGEAPRVRCACTVVADVAVIELFRKYAPELFTTT